MLYVPASKMPPSFGIEYGRGRDLARGAEKNIASSSAASEINISQIVGPENGPAIVPVYDWQQFLSPIFRPLPGIKSHHHFTISSDHPGTVVYKEFGNSEMKKHTMLKVSLKQVC